MLTLVNKLISIFIVQSPLKLYVHFRFPFKNPERNQLWIIAIRRKGFIPTKNSFVCSDHFLRSDFNFKPGGSYRLYLNETAVPSIIPDPSIKQTISRISIVEIGNGNNTIEELGQNSVLENNSELNVKDLHDSENVYEVFIENSESPAQEKKKQILKIHCSLLHQNLKLEDHYSLHQ